MNQSSVNLKPRLSFRVGFVGHRPNRLQRADTGALHQALGTVLACVKQEVEKIREKDKEWYSDAPPDFQAITSLAEGSDRMFAAEAINLGYGLSCPMPFLQEDFEADFAPGNALEPDSISHFRELMDRARQQTSLTRFELAGDRNQEALAYRVSGQMILNQSDILVVVWDSLYQKKIGGTEDLMQEAIALHIPVVWVHGKAPHLWRLIDRDNPLPPADSGARLAVDHGQSCAGLAGVVSNALAMPGSGFSGTLTDQSRLLRLREFYHESLPQINPAILWRFFRNLAGKHKLTLVSIRKKVPDASVCEPPILGYGKGELNRCREIKMGFAHCDWLSEYYGDFYRSGYILTFLLAALAVGLALFPLAAGWITSGNHTGELIFAAIELVTLILILFLVSRSKRRRWHSRWLDYRLAAEWIRQLVHLAPLGIGKTIHETRAHQQSYEHPSSTWMAWYVRALERNLGLPDARIDEAYLGKYLDNLSALIHEQRDYHQSNSLINHRIGEFLHKSGLILLGATIASCIIHLLPVVIPKLELHPGFLHVLTFLCGFMPALGAALAGINNQGEFNRLKKTSESMFRAYQQISIEMSDIQTKLHGSEGKAVVPLFPQVRDLAHRISQLIIEELNDWRITYHNRPPVLPA